MKRPAAVELSAGMGLHSNSHMSQNEGSETSYCEPDNHLLETDTTDEGITKTDADIMCFIELSKKFPPEYGESLWSGALRGDRFSDEYMLKGIFLEGVPSRSVTKGYFIGARGERYSTRPGL